MKKALALRRRLNTLRTLTEAVGAMRSLSAHHFRVIRSELTPARVYREQVLRIMSEIDVRWPSTAGKPAIILILATDLGLCGDYVSRVASAMMEYAAGLPEVVVWCIGRRAKPALLRGGIEPARIYAAPSSISGSARLLLELVDDLQSEFAAGRIGAVTAVTARFEGAGKFTPVRTDLIPSDVAPAAEVIRPSPYVDANDLSAAATREFLYISLYEIVLDALTAEYGMRLVATGAARQWLDEQIGRTLRLLRADRREESTQELLDIVAAARPVRAVAVESLF